MVEGPDTARDAREGVGCAGLVDSAVARNVLCLGDSVGPYSASRVRKALASAFTDEVDPGMHVGCGDKESARKGQGRAGQGGIIRKDKKVSKASAYAVWQRMVMFGCEERRRGYRSLLL